MSNNKVLSKTGVYIGQSLIDNPDYPISEILFKDVNIEPEGVMRIIEAVNSNKNIKKIHAGIISDQGLDIISNILKDNSTLFKLEF